MAEAQQVGIEQLEQEITCPVCQDVFEEPKILPCCHYYCKKCIDALARRVSPNHPFPCPECRVDTLLPQNDSEQLPTAFFVNRMKELYSKMQKAHGNVEARCEQCHGAVYVAFCHQCKEFICAECVDTHEKLKNFSKHKVVSLEELKKGGAKQLLVCQTPPPQTCWIHNQPMKTYCFDCSHLICQDCIAINHTDHKSELTNLAAPEKRKQVAEHLDPLKKVQVSLCSAVEEVEAKKFEIMAQGKAAAANIEDSVEELHIMLEQHKNNLLDESSMIVEEKVIRLSTQEQSLSTASARIQSLMDLVEQTLQNTTDEEFMSLHTQIEKRIDKGMEENRKEAANLDLSPVEEADIQVDVSESEVLTQLCEADPSKCTVDGPGLDRPKVNQQTHVVVRTYIHSGMPTCSTQRVTAELKSVVNGSIVQLKGLQGQGGAYDIQLTPTVRGRHILLVNVNNRPIAGNPFPINVKISPKDLCNPVRVISGLDRPYGVTINSAEEVLITEQKSIAVFDKNGTKLRDIKLPITIDSGRLTGIEVDADDNLYVCDEKHHCVMKLSKDGTLLKTTGRKGSGPGEFNYPNGVTVVGDCVFVCDRYNHRVQLLRKDNLEFVKTITSCGGGQGIEQLRGPKDITRDELGNLYISSVENGHITVCDCSGDFVRTLGKKAGGGQLKKPVGVCVVDEFVYVVEHGGECVSVINSRDGKFVASFGKGGKKEGEFCQPFWIFVDCDGFVYVCDTGNGRVQVF